MAGQIVQDMTPENKGAEIEVIDGAEADEVCRRIRDRWQDSAQAIIDVGRMLIEAREKSPHGSWQWMFSDRNPNRVPFSDSTARMLMRTAGNPVISNRYHGNDLPPSWRTLYELSQIPEPELERAFTEGRITPDMERKDVKALMYGHGGDEGLGDEWYTPKWIFDGLGIVFSIDVCGPADRTHIAVPSEQYYTEEDDGLASEWWGTIWCNPPYSDPEPWATKCIEHGDGLLLTHIPMNAGWASAVWQKCDGLRLFQAIEFVRPDGKLQRPGMWLQIAAFGSDAVGALERLRTPDDVSQNPRRVPSPLLVKRG
jgi:phage N-6-adenine-methyltransferase